MTMMTVRTESFLIPKTSLWLQPPPRSGRLCVRCLRRRCPARLHGPAAAERWNSKRWAAGLAPRCTEAPKLRSLPSPSHVNTCHMSHVNTLDASQQLQRKTPNLQGNNMEQHEQLNLTKLLPKLLTTVKGPFRVLPIEPAGTAQMLLGGRINLGLKLRVRTWFKMIEVSDSTRRSKIRNHQKGHLEI